MLTDTEGIPSTISIATRVADPAAPGPAITTS